MKNNLYRIVLALLLVLGSLPMLYAQQYETELPRYFEISDGAEWTSELLTFEEPIEGFRLTVFKSNYASNTYNGYPVVGLDEVELTDASGNEVSYSATSNSLANNDGLGLAGLSDKNTGAGGYYCSAYSGNVEVAPNDYVYIEFTFDTPQRAIQYKQVRRQNQRDFPLHFTLSPLGAEANPPFNPNNPSEPDNGYVEPVVYYKVTQSAQPASAAYVNSGGEFTSGTKVWIDTSVRDSRYKFSYWTLNGEYYSDKQYFYYNVEDFDADFVAHYEFDPSSPVEPEPLPEIITNPLYLTTNIEGACAFNQASGNEHEADTWVDLNVTVAKGYEFKGWYCGTTLLSSNVQFNYQMPAEATTLTAKVSKIVFNPENPSEPNGSQNNVQTTRVGDTNKDGVVNILDIIAVVNYSLSGDGTNISLYDLNGDGAVNILDIIKTVNISME